MTRPWTVYSGDCRAVLRDMDPESIDACVTDTPYGLSTILDPPNLDREALWRKLMAHNRNRRPLRSYVGDALDEFVGREGRHPGRDEFLDIVEAAERKRILEGPAIERLMKSWLDTGENPKVKGRGFMGKEWDALVPPPNTWREVWRVLKPGAYCLAFGGTRTYALIEMALRFADFEVEDTVSWLYGQGFPKRVRLDLKIDQHFGKAGERPVTGSKLGQPGYHLHPHAGGATYGDGVGRTTAEQRLRASQEFGAATPEAARFVGWDRALRPGWEPIIVAVKPLRGTVAENALAHGTGGLHIDACRLPRGDAEVTPQPDVRPENRGIYGRGLGGGLGGMSSALGGYPANVAMDGQELPLLRLKRSLPEETEQVIRRYFCGSSMPHMRGRVFSSPESNRSGEGSALLSGVLCETSVEYKAWQPASDVWQASQPKGHRGDAGGRPAQHEGWTGEPAVQGLHDVARVQDAYDIGFGRQGEGACSGDGDTTGEGVRAPLGDGAASWQTAAAHGGCPSHQRREDRQQGREPGDARRRDTQARAPGHHQGTATTSAGQRMLDVTADVVPVGWLEYFEYTGRSVIDPDSPAALLDAMSGHMRDGVAVKRNTEIGKVTGRIFQMGNTGHDQSFGGGGGASRFFYTAKASSSERDAGLDDLPSLTAGERCDREDGSAGINAYAGTNGEGGRNPHPTVKPVSLMRWLCRLASPPGAHDPDMSKRPVILDPFFGSGSTGVAALQEGVRVVGVELDEKMADVARRRLQHTYALPRDDEQVPAETGVAAQRSLF